ncbi:MAG: prepilin peptidase [Anaerolineaceae bacterium]|nr:prepilin peptidase [Anaerolineaceae bacterium]
MEFFIAIFSGIVLGLFSNFILDYLPFGRVLENRKIRQMKIKEGVTTVQFSIKQYMQFKTTTLFEELKFPYCHQCYQQRSWGDYLAAKKCVHCQEHPPKRFWVVLLNLPAAFLILTIFPVLEFRIVDMFLLLTFYLIVFIMDVEHRVILFPITVAGILFGIYFGLSYHSFVSTLIGALVGGGIMLLFYWIGILYIQYVRKTSDPDMNEVALGFGDVSLSFILGLILGWPGILGGLFFGILLGGIISGVLLLFKFLTKKYAPNDLILPYAPFLIIGAFIIMLM